MNISICHRRLSCAFLISIITPAIVLGNNEPQNPIATKQAMPSQQEFHTLMQEMLEPYFTQLVTQVHLLDCMLQDLAFNIGNNSTIPTKNRGQSIAKIRAMRETLAELKTTQYVVLDEHIINSFVIIVRTTIAHIKKALESGIDNLKSLESDEIFGQAQQLPSLDHLAKELAQNEASIKSLMKLADNLGLHWYNKAYRHFKHYVADPVKIVAPWALGASILAGAGFFLWYYSDAENPKWLRNWVGYKAVFANEVVINDPAITKKALEDLKNKYTQSIIAGLGDMGYKYPSDAVAILAAKQNLPETASTLALAQEKPTKWLGNLEVLLHGFNHGNYEFGKLTLAAGSSVGLLYLPGVSRWVSKKIKDTDNFLMGGAYKNRTTGSYIYSSDVTLKDVIGQEEAKKYIREICLYLKNPELYDRTKIAPATGLLLFGDTRTGKSFLISALFGEIQQTLGAEGAAFKMRKVTFEDILKYGIEQIMEAARYEAPIILVIEEIDLLGLQRTNNAQRLAEFMTAMSSCLQENALDKTVIVIGTTNKLENLEPALRTDGRFGKHLFFDYPTFKDRKECIERELVKTACDIRKFDIDKLARDTAGCSFEKIKQFIKRTFLRAKLYNETVCQESLERSIDESIRGISANEVILDKEQKELIAVHLAGHTVVSILLDPHQKVSKVTLRDVASKIEEQLLGMSVLYKDNKQEAMEHGKVFANYDRDMPGIESKQEKIKQCKITLAGHVAENLLLGSCGYGYHPHDKQAALTIAKSITCGALDLTTLTDKLRDQYYDEAFALMNRCEAEVTQLLEEHRTELVALVNALIEKLTLDATELRRIVLHQEPVIATEELDASSMLADLLKNQPGMYDELGTNTQPIVLPTAVAAA